MKNWYFLLFLLMSMSVCAQDSTIRYLRPALVILKLAPLWLIDNDPAVMGGVEVRTGPRTSVQTEFGYGGPGWGTLGSSYQHAGTWRIKTELRFYRNQYRTNRQRSSRVSTTYPLGNYQAIEVYAKILNVNHDWNYGEPVTGPSVPAVAVEPRRTLIRRNSLSLTYKIGRQFGWADNAHQGTARLLWDVYAGLGIRLTHQTNDSDWNTPGYSARRVMVIFDRFDNNGFKIVPTLTAGIKLGFAL